MKTETETTQGMDDLEQQAPEQEVQTPPAQPEADGQQPDTPVDDTFVKPVETEPAEKKVDSAPLHVVEKLRAEKRDAELKAARLEGQLEAEKQAKAQQAAVQQKSPLQIAAEEQGIDTTQPGWKKEVVVNGEIYEAQAAWDNNRRVMDSRAQSVVQFAKDKPDFENVITQGQEHLTMKERNEIDRSTSDYGPKAYELCQKALKRAGVEEPNNVPKNPPAKPAGGQPPVPAKPQPPKKEDVLLGVSPQIQRVMAL